MEDEQSDRASSAARELALLRALQEASPSGTLLIDEEGKVRHYNSRFAEQWQLGPDEASVGEPATRLIAHMAQLSTQPEKLSTEMRALIGDPYRTTESSVPLEDGRVFDCRTAAVVDDEDALLGRAWFFRDITAQEQVKQRLEKLARTDPLTGLPNRRHFDELINKECRRSQRYQRTLSLLLLDIDRFKDINDAHGHAAGDEVLRALGQALMQELREVDFLGRVGGDEFAAMLPETDLKNAENIAERLRKRASSLRVQPADSTAEVALSISVGVTASRFGTDEVVGELWQRADDSLYAAKSAGRNRVQCAP